MQQHLYLGILQNIMHFSIYMFEVLVQVIVEALAVNSGHTGTAAAVHAHQNRLPQHAEPGHVEAEQITAGKL